MNFPIEIIWFFKAQLARHDRLAQRRTRNHEKIQYSHTAQTSDSKQPALSSAMPLSILNHSAPPQGEDGESDKPDDIQASNERAERSQLQPSVSSETRSSNTLNTNMPSQQPYQNKPRLRHNGVTAYVRKVTQAILSTLRIVPANLPANKAGRHQATDNHKPHWKSIGVSVAGTSHLKRQTPCQDAHIVQELQGGALVIAVADGAGSASRAQEGAEFAVHSAMNFLCQAIPLYKPNTIQAWKELVSQSFDLVRGELIHHAVANRIRVKNYATTLQIVILSKQWVVSAIVGDGAAVVLDTDKSFRMIMTPQRGQYANATNFITSNAARSKPIVEVWQEPVFGVAVMTDGLLNLSIEEKNNKPVPKFFQSLFQFMAATASRQQAADSLAKFLRSDQVSCRTDDDKTLVLALRRPVPSNLGVDSCDLKQPPEEESS